MKFIDLFSGLGSFHVALSKLGHECVFACEIDENLAQLYEKNFGIKVFRDIRKLDPENLPEYDILCAGFPCQPFSKAGKQEGLGDLQNGQYLAEIVKILNSTKPDYFILENVPNLRKHDKEKTWNKIYKRLHDECGYYVKESILSPHEFGIPQIRKRLFIVGSKKGLDHFKFPTKNNKKLNVNSILTKNAKKVQKISEDQIECIDLWQNILDKIPKQDPLISPIWGMEFGATYPFEKKAPFFQSSKKLAKYKGSFGKSLKGMNKEEQLNSLPIYARAEHYEFPEWKKNFIRKNRIFFSKYHNLIKPLIIQLKKFSSSWQKFEWNCLNEERNIKKHLIQFRASGIRVKRTNYFPALVLSTSQRPIIGWEERYITPKEAARLQSLENIKLPKHNGLALKYLGNSINTKILEKIGDKLFLF